MRYWFYYSTWLSRSFPPDQNGQAEMFRTSMLRWDTISQEANCRGPWIFLNDSQGRADLYDSSGGRRPDQHLCFQHSNSPTRGPRQHIATHCSVLQYVILCCSATSMPSNRARCWVLRKTWRSSLIKHSDLQVFPTRVMPRRAIWQCVAVLQQCSTLQTCGKWQCGALVQCGAMCCRWVARMPCFSLYFYLLQCVAAHCSVLQCGTLQCTVVERQTRISLCSFIFIHICYSVLQRVAACCNDRLSLPFPPLSISNTPKQFFLMC